jgi:hypothetical protein
MPTDEHLYGSIGPFRGRAGGRYTRGHPLRLSNEPELARIGPLRHED